jgi:alcohol dehydrogenase (cytochrome c)
MPRLRERVTLAVAGALVAAGLAGALMVDAVRWRAIVLGRVATGQITDLGLMETVRMLRARNVYYLRPLVGQSNPNAVITNPYTSAADAEAGAQSFRERCILCHESGGTKSDAPDLLKREFKYGGSDWALFRHITRGIPGTAMRAQGVSERQAWQLIAYLRGLVPAAGEPDVEGDSSAVPDVLGQLQSVDAARLVDVRKRPADWLSYSGAYDGWRYSPLARITPANVSQLRTRWVFQPPLGSAPLKASPVVVDGVMFVTTSEDRVFALDAATGNVLWSYVRELPEDLRLCCGRVNRGVAVHGMKVYLTTLDAHLIALHAKTGRLAWDVQLAPYADGYSGTGAPLAVGDTIVTGIAGGEFGARGFVDAYDAESGHRLWRFQAVPGPGEKGNETWEQGSWKTGGAPTWLTGTFDPESNLIYWGVGNPAPDFSGDRRKGDNLYSSSVVALDAATGRLQWHFQFTPHDEHDWDAVHVPILVDATLSGARRKLLVEANRNGFYYVLDRRTGKFLLARPYVRQNWALEIDSAGRPVLSPNASPSTAGTLTFPSVAGGTNWQSSTYSPQTGYLYVPTLDQAGVFFKGPVARREASGTFLGSAFQTLAEGGWSSVQAIQVTTGDVVWEHRFNRESHENAQRVCGLMATRGGVVFGCNGNSFIALDATGGSQLWSLNTGSAISAAPIAFEAGGAELVTVSAGGILVTFGL